MFGSGVDVTAVGDSSGAIITLLCEVLCDLSSMSP